MSDAPDPSESPQPAETPEVVGSGLDLSGLTDALRARPPAVGTWVTYRFNGLTGGGVPRFPRFLRVREELPPPDPD